METEKESQIDFGSSKVNKLIVHRVGNKIRDESLELSRSEAIVTEDIEGLILRGFLANITSEQNTFEFFHESNLGFNEVYAYTNNLFKNEIDFHEFSSGIAKHLYANSLHPNIKSGDLFIIIFNGILVNSTPREAIGLFKTEIIDDYFSINKAEESFKVIHSQGINTNTLDKGALIINGIKSIYAVDKIGNKSKYWIDDFLKIKKVADKITCNKILSKTIEQISKDTQDPISTSQVIEEISSNKHELITCKELREITCRVFPEEIFDKALEKVQNKFGVELPLEQPISREKIAKQTISLLNKITLPHGLKMLIPNNYKFSKFKTEENEGFLRIVVDMEKKK